MMKKSALAVVVAASMLPAAAMAETTLYGQARVFFVNDDNGTNDAWALESEASRLGVKGSAELDGNLEAIYKLEYEVDPADSGAASGNGAVEQVFKRRNQYVGLKGNFGQVILGRHDTPLKKAQGKIDLFNDYYEADIKRALTPVVENGENRVNSVIYYKSPAIADAVNIHVALVPGETPGGDDGIADSTSIAVTYNTDSLFLSLASDDFANDDKLVRLAGQFKGDGFGAGLIYQTAENAAGTEETGFVLSGYYKATDNTKLKLQHVSSEVDATGGTETTQTTLGVDYKLGKKTTLAGYYTTREQEAAGTTLAERDVFGAGLIHKF
ncbi:MAG: hypothetical protein CSA54_01515 [Gammaproteobacteria bacterium]|nr:MAG: hypothetical protein CSA54_01515 [Gammaproteobacteria bacterium]